MGLVKEGWLNFVVLSDILGDKITWATDFVAGTEGTGLQMDIKIQGITEEIMKALAQACWSPPAHPRRDGHAITTPRGELSEAPRLLT
jgi:polyribonucleotide nucleotidyltransferase